MDVVQPITVSPDGKTIRDTRHCTAVVQLGSTTGNVLVRAGIPTDVEQLPAKQHENTLGTNFTPPRRHGCTQSCRDWTVHEEGLCNAEIELVSDTYHFNFRSRNVCGTA
jgi:hypothetical protein